MSSDPSFKERIPGQVFEQWEHLQRYSECLLALLDRQDDIVTRWQISLRASLNNTQFNRMMAT